MAEILTTKMTLIMDGDKKLPKDKFKVAIEKLINFANRYPIASLTYTKSRKDRWRDFGKESIEDKLRDLLDEYDSLELGAEITVYGGEPI